MKKKHLLLLTCLIFLTACSATEEKKTTVSFDTLGTSVAITVYGDKREKALTEVRACVENYDRLWSADDPDSDISLINRERTDCRVDTETMTLLDKASQFRTDTGRAFDPFLRDLILMWQDAEGKEIPDGTAIRTALREAEASGLHVGDATVSLTGSASIDLGAIAKGYIGDKVAEILKENGISSAICDLGGNIRLVGTRPDGSLWKVGILSPDNDGTLTGYLSAADTSVVTSGQYERFVTDSSGEKYGHILDPDTGYPAESGLKSVTIVSDDGAKADACATAVFVMGLEKGVAFWRETGGFQMILVDSENKVYVTQGLKEYFTPSAGSQVTYLTDAK